MRILQRVPSGKERIVQMILNFIAYANPKLDTAILREALSVPEEVDNEDALNSQSVIREGSITMLCRSLIRRSNDGRYYEFAHFSVQEFLEGEMKAMPEFEKFQVSESICKLLLAKQCLKYLLFRNFSSPPMGEAELKDHLEMRIKQHPFYFYAAVCWPIFAKFHWMDAGLVDLARRLFQPKRTGNFIAWALELTSFVAFTPYVDETFHAISMTDALDEFHLEQILRLLPWVTDKSFTALHVAAARSLEALYSGSIGEGPNIDQKSAFGCPLHCAVKGLYLALEYADEVGYMDVCHDFDCRRGHEIPTGFSGEETIGLLFHSGATHLRASSGRFAGQTLITVALKVAFWMGNLSAINIFLDAGYGVKEEDLIQFNCFRETLMVEGSHLDGHDKYGLEHLILCLGSMIDKSASHFRLCQAAWSLAIEIGCEFVQDPSIIDTRISLSRDALVKTIFTSIRDADNETLIEALKDPRADIANVTNDDNKTVFEEWSHQAGSIPTLQMLKVLKTLLSAGMGVDRRNDQGLLPIHVLAECFSGTADDDHRYDDLRDIIGNFIRRGTGCIAQSRSNQNVFHFGIKSIGFIKAVLEAETDENTLTALRTQDDNGHTPINLALQDGHEDVALLLLEISKCDLESLRGPASIHALCVSEDAHRAFNFLLDAGIALDKWSKNGRKNTLLHYLGPRTSKPFILQLTQMFPGGMLCRVDGKLPLDVYLEGCITCEPPTFDLDILQLLAVCGSDELDQREKAMSWERFTITIEHVIRITRVAGYTERVMQQVQENIANAVAVFLQLRYFQSYEEVLHAPGVLPLLKHMQDSLKDLWPISNNAIYDILERTVLWDALRETAVMLRLLKAAINSQDVNLIGLLLENGVGVHQRIDEMSALEMACLEPADKPEAKRVFTLLLDHADSSRLDEVNPHQGQQRGLVHFLAGPGKQWQLEELLKRGVDVNSRTSINVPAEPAIVHHLIAECSESAITLLENGADPTTTDVFGMDAALAAALTGDLAFLLHLRRAEGRVWRLNWQRTFSGRLGSANYIRIEVSTINALHLAAWGGKVDILEFYVDNDLLTDLNCVSVELLTPTHLAAFSGHVDAVKFLYSRGGDLGLKSVDGSMPLHLAVRNGHTDVVKFLVDNGSVMDADSHGLSPVGYAMRLQNQSILDCFRATKQFLDYQTEPKQPDKDFAHAFEQALIREDIEYCEMLRMQGFSIDIDLPGQRGRSALMLAIENTKKELIKWLLTHDVKGTENALHMNTGQISPLQAMIVRPALNNVLPILLQKYNSEDCPLTPEEPSPICIAIRCNNNLGLKLLLDHIARHETTSS